MSPNPRIRPDSAQSTSPRDDKPADDATALSSTQATKNVTQVAQTLAAHVGGAISMDLAFDLVLNEFVEQAREASGATGAAIALIRDGEMVCRATSGENAPDLGVRVETGSGLAGACLATGEIQLCRDTENDSRVSAEACRRLGVRSMLIAPLIDAGNTFGILQAFSAWPNSFGEREISTLKGLTQRISDSKREAEAGIEISASVDESGSASGSGWSDIRKSENETHDLPPEYSPLIEPEEPKGKEAWTSILVLLVVAAAVLLGLVIGWSGAVKGWFEPQPAPQTSTALASAPVNNAPQQGATHTAVPAVQPSTSDSAADVKAASTANSSSVPAGGLVITENGKVIYHTQPSEPQSSSRPNAAAHSGTKLIHRVEPEYPTAAREKNIEGPVILDVQIGGDGKVESVNVVSGDPILAEAALKAVRQWRYQPSFVNGHPVESQTRITIKFILPL